VDKNFVWYQKYLIFVRLIYREVMKKPLKKQKSTKVVASSKGKETPKKGKEVRNAVKTSAMAKKKTSPVTPAKSLTKKAQVKTNTSAKSVGTSPKSSGKKVLSPAVRSVTSKSGASKSVSSKSVKAKPASGRKPAPTVSSKAQKSKPSTVVSAKKSKPVTSKTKPAPKPSKDKKTSAPALKKGTGKPAGKAQPTKKKVQPAVAPVASKKVKPASRPVVAKPSVKSSTGSKPQVKGKAEPAKPIKKEKGQVAPVSKTITKPERPKKETPEKKDKKETKAVVAGQGGEASKGKSRPGKETSPKASGKTVASKSSATSIPAPVKPTDEGGGLDPDLDVAGVDPIIGGEEMDDSDEIALLTPEQKKQRKIEKERQKKIENKLRKNERVFIKPEMDPSILTANNVRKEFLELKYSFDCEPRDLFLALTKSEYMRNWLAERVEQDEKTGVYSFHWRNYTESARIVEKVQDRYLKWQWVGGERPNNEFLIFSIDMIPGDVYVDMYILDICEPGEREIMTRGWDKLMDRLRVIVS
jgi:uncharacterized protein YndB with AHSA1/START domain